MASKSHKILSQLTIRAYSTNKKSSPTVWGLFSKKKDEKDLPSPERCRKKKETQEDPDLSRFGGQAYRTCGTAYVIQRDVIPPLEVEASREDEVLKSIETDFSATDPMPPFESVEQRLIQLNEHRLHPLYKKFVCLRKKKAPEARQAVAPYKFKTGPVQADEIPDILRFNKELLERKNIFADFKRVELPKQMVVRIVEMDKNRKPTMERKEEKEEGEEKKK